MTLPVPTKEAIEECTRKPLQSLTWQRMQECRMGILMNHLGGERGWAKKQKEIRVCLMEQKYFERGGIL